MAFPPVYGGGTLTQVSLSGSDLPTTCATINQFVVIGVRNESEASWHKVRWCAIGDPTDWPIPASSDARSKQAGQEILPGQYGMVTAVSGGDFFGYVFQERAVTKMTYVGGDVVFTFDTLEVGRGCWQFNRRMIVDDTVFYESLFGYQSLTNGQILNIGKGRVDKTYPPQITNIGTNGQAEQQNVVYNKAINCVFFESQNLCYNHVTDQWTRVPGLTANRFVSIDDATGIIGQAALTATTGGALFDQKGGANATATVVTGEATLGFDGRAVVDSIRPITDGGSLTSLRVGVRDLLSDSLAYATGTAPHSRTGLVHLRGGSTTPEGRYHRAEFVFTGGFTTISGAEFDFFPAGKT